MVTDRGLDSHLYNRFRGLEDDLLGALESDATSMRAFVERLSDLQLLMNGGIAQKLLSTPTLALVRKVASSGMLLANHFLDIQRINVDVEKKRQLQLENAFSRMNLVECTSDDSGISYADRSLKPYLQNRRLPTAPKISSRIKRSESCASTSSSATAVDIKPIPSHIPRAYDWLVKHLHNPYPSAQVKSRISKETEVPLKSVSEWFVNIRRRIGWTSICKSFFNGNRALAIDCAKSFFLDDSSCISEDLVVAFASMKQTAERLFDGKLETSEIAQQLDALVKDVATDVVTTMPTKRGSGYLERSGRKGKRRKRNDDKAELSSSEETPDDCRPTKRIRNIRMKSSSHSEYSSNSSSLSRSPTTEPITPIADNLDLFEYPSSIPDSHSYNLPLDPNLHLGLHVNPRKRRLSFSEADNNSAKKRLVEWPSSMQLTTVPDIHGSNALVWPNDNGELDRVLAGFDFSIPESAVLGEQIPDGLLDLNVFDTSTYPIGQVTLDASGRDIAVSNWLNTSGVDSYAGVVDQTTATLERIEEFSQLLSTMHVQKQSDIPPFGLDEVQQLLFDGVDLFPDSLSIPNSQPSFGFETLQDFVSGASDEFNLDSNSSYHSLESVLKTSPDSQPDISQPTPEVIAAPLQPLHCETLIDGLLKSDRQAKLEQLAKLREEKDRLAEEEKQLEQILSQSH